MGAKYNAVGVSSCKILVLISGFARHSTPSFWLRIMWNIEYNVAVSNF